MPETTDDSAFAGPGEQGRVESPIGTLDQGTRGAVESSAGLDLQTAQRPPQEAEYRASADLRQQERVRGSRPGDTYVRYERHVGAFRRISSGLLSASIETE
ncbi:MAG: hypothetical protein ABJA50_06035, partial [Chloroflexota bacterium]